MYTRGWKSDGRPDPRACALLKLFRVRKTNYTTNYTRTFRESSWTFANDNDERTEQLYLRLHFMCFDVQEIWKLAFLSMLNVRKQKWDEVTMIGY